MSWTHEEIHEANPKQPGQRQSRLERMIDLGQAHMATICETAEELESRPSNCVAAFFQLPYPVCIEPGWYAAAASRPGVIVDLRFGICRVGLTPKGGLGLARDQAAIDHWPAVTQVIALIPLWGRRALYHEKYVYHATSGRGGNPIIVPQGQYWHDTGPAPLGQYEIHLATSLLPEIRAALRSFLPAYSVVALREAPIPGTLFSYFTMLAPGHLVFVADSVSAADGLLKHATEKLPEVRKRTEVQAALKTRYRNFTRFETQLFALERLRCRGEPALALISTLSLIEWLLNSYLRAKDGAAARNLATAIRSVSLLSEDEKSIIDRARLVRNELVHGQPPDRHSLTSAGSGDGVELGGSAVAISTEEVRQLMEIAFRAFRSVNQSGLVRLY